MDVSTKQVLAGLAVGGLGIAAYFGSRASAALSEERGQEVICMKNENCRKTELLQSKVRTLQMQLVAKQREIVANRDNERKIEAEFAKNFAEISVLKGVIDYGRRMSETAQSHNDELAEKIRKLEEELELKTAKEQGFKETIFQLKKNIDNINRFYQEMLVTKKMSDEDRACNDSFKGVQETNTVIRERDSDITTQYISLYHLKATRELSLLKSRLIGKEATVRRLERQNEEQKLLISQLTERRQGKETKMERPFSGGEDVTDDIITYEMKQPCLDTDTVSRPKDKNGSVDEVNFVCNVDNTSNSVIVCEQEHADHTELQTPPTVEKSPKRKGTQGVKSSPRSPFMSKFWKRKSKRSKSDSAANMYASHENLAKKENLI